jgi:hypothetical protein
MESDDFQCAADLKDKFELFLLGFNKNYVSEEKHPARHTRARKHAVFMTSLFGSAYLCRQKFTMMKRVMCMKRS